MSYVGLLFAAVASPHGVKVPTNDPALLRQHLYKERRADLDTFEGLSIIISPISPDEEIWIVKNGAANAQD